MVIREKLFVNFIKNGMIIDTNFLATSQLITNFHISGGFEGISRHLKGARFKMFSDHGGITPKSKLLYKLKYVKLITKLLRNKDARCTRGRNK